MTENALSALVWSLYIAVALALLAYLANVGRLIAGLARSVMAFLLLWALIAGAIFAYLHFHSV